MFLPFFRLTLPQHLLNHVSRMFIWKIVIPTIRMCAYAYAVCIHVCVRSLALLIMLLK